MAPSPTRGASASDNCPGSLPVSVSGSLDVNAVGSYILTYSATDAQGNTANATGDRERR